MSHERFFVTHPALTAAILMIVLPVGLVLAQNQAVTVTVDAALDELNVPLHRHGGNATSRYNWQRSHLLG